MLDKENFTLLGNEKSSMLDNMSSDKVFVTTDVDGNDANI